MRKERAVFLLLILFLLPLACASQKYSTLTKQSAENNENDDQIIISEISCEHDQEVTKINFFLNRMTDYTLFKQNAPEALILDITNAYIHESINRLAFEEGPAKSIEPIQKDDTARFIINLSYSSPYNMEAYENKLSLILDNSESIQQDVDRGELWQRSISIADEESPTYKSKLIRTIKSKTTTPAEPPQEITKENDQPIYIQEKSDIQEKSAAKILGEAFTVGEKGYNDSDLEFETKKYTGQLIALDFQDADIKSVLRLIADISGRNLVIDPQVSGRVNIRLTIPIPWDQALDVILKTHKLDMVMEDNIIRVGKPETFINERKVRKDAIIAKREAQEERIRLKPLVTEIIPINYTTASQIAGSIKGMLSKESGLAEKPSITTDQRTNILIIKDLPESIEKMKKIIAILDSQTPQVMIEARIVTTSKTFARQLGIQWGGYHNKLSTGYDFPSTVSIDGQGLNGSYAVSVPPGGAYGKIGISLGHINGLSGLDAVLSAMEESGKGKVVSNPRIATLDNESANITSGVQLPYLTVNADGQSSVTFQNASISLDVTPHITPNNNILLDINAAKCSPDWGNSVAGQPAIKQNSVQTKYIVKNGETAVIGGLMETSDSIDTDKVPWFASIPIVGFFFRNKKTTKEHNELLIFITPLTINPPTLI
ncbi:MAG: type IV pilus secretin PilQ [bacterium]